MTTKATTSANGACPQRKVANQSGNDGQDGLVGVEPYNMHVSAKYLELTKRKLELTRLPHELELPEGREWEYGTSKAVLEPLVDYWLSDYSWRAQESHYNTVLPQYRTSITIPSTSTTPTSTTAASSSGETLRVHFIHKRCRPNDDEPITPPAQNGSGDVNVIPLLFCHDVRASSFLDVSCIIDALTMTTGSGSGTTGEKDGGRGEVGFHVVAPSVPGTGYSDASGEEGFGVCETADVFDALMKRLGYEQYVAFGAGWGFAICRALALRHGPESCIAIHTANPVSFFPPPSLRATPLEWLRYQLARVTGARIPGLNFGYAPADFGVSRPPVSSKLKVVDEESAVSELPKKGSGNEEIGAWGSACVSRPITLAYALCDSPAGLLAHTLDVLRPCLTLGRAGFLRAVWTPVVLLNWTMMRWLPGPEAGLRWMQNARRDGEVGGVLWRAHSSVPLGISQFGGQRGVGGRADGMLRWARAWQEVRWLKVREASNVIRPEWESPEELVQDVRESFGRVWFGGTGAC